MEEEGEELPLGASLSAAELDALGVGRSQHFPKGASKAKTAARKAAKVRHSSAFVRLAPPSYIVRPDEGGESHTRHTHTASPNHDRCVHCAAARPNSNPNSASAR